MEKNEHERTLKITNSKLQFCLLGEQMDPHSGEQGGLSGLGYVTDSWEKLMGWLTTDQPPYSHNLYFKIMEIVKAEGHQEPFVREIFCGILNDLKITPAERKLIDLTDQREKKEKLSKELEADIKGLSASIISAGRLMRDSIDHKNQVLATLSRHGIEIK